MKLKLDYFYNFVKSNPFHFSNLNSEIGEFFNAPPTCLPCAKMAGNTAKNNNHYEYFRRVISNPSNYKLIIDKAKELLQDEIELENFSVITSNEKDQTK